MVKIGITFYLHIQRSPPPAHPLITNSSFVVSTRVVVRYECTRLDCNRVTSSLRNMYSYIRNHQVKAIVTSEFHGEIKSIGTRCFPILWTNPVKSLTTILHFKNRLTHFLHSVWHSIWVMVLSSSSFSSSLLLPHPIHCPLLLYHAHDAYENHPPIIYYFILTGRKTTHIRLIHYIPMGRIFVTQTSFFFRSLFSPPSPPSPFSQSPRSELSFMNSSPPPPLLFLPRPPPPRDLRSSSFTCN